MQQMILCLIRGEAIDTGMEQHCTTARAEAPQTVALVAAGILALLILVAIGAVVAVYRQLTASGQRDSEDYHRQRRVGDGDCR